MSSKFTKNSAVQKTPAVCRKPPEELPADPAPFEERIFQAYMIVRAPGTPGPFWIAGLAAIHPTFPPFTWFAQIGEPPDEVSIGLTTDASLQLFEIELTKLLNGIPIGSHTFANIRPKSLTPFELPQVTFAPAATSQLWEARISD